VYYTDFPAVWQEGLRLRLLVLGIMDIMGGMGEMGGIGGIGEMT